jgi:hypothetical protein
MDWKPAAGVALAVAAAVLLWDHWVVFPLKLYTVMLHESGHALAALIAGGSVDRIAVSPGEGGVTFFRVQEGLLRSMWVASAGYLGSMLLGATTLALALRTRGRWLIAAHAAWLSLALVLWVRDLFTAAFVLGWALALAALARFGTPAALRATGVFLGAFASLYALFDIRADLLRFGGSGGSDADRMAELTYIPAIAWGVLWLAAAVGSLVLALRWGLRAAPAAIPASRGP